MAKGRRVTGCDKCGSVTSHLRGCENGQLAGHGVGQKRERTPQQAVVWERTKAAVQLRDRGRCRWCGRDAWEMDVHHVETVQQVHARGGGWDEADTVENCVLLCRVCHVDVVHCAVRFDEVVARGFLIDKRAAA